MSERPSHVINVDDVEEIEHLWGKHWGGAYKPLTPLLKATPGRLGVNLSRLPKGRATCPFHFHQRDDEVFYVISGRGRLRYGDDVREIGPGDCISCPAGTKVAHQIGNPYDEDLVYLAIGGNDPDEVCVYPDTGKVMVRSLRLLGHVAKTEYLEGEADVPKVLVTE